MSASIYALIDPDTLEIRYIGLTCQSLNVRLNKHVNDAKRRPYARYPVYDWIRILAEQGKRPIIEAVNTDVQDDHLERLEALWIGLYQAWGHRLTNTSPGGNGIAHRHKKTQQVEKNYVQDGD